jgi:hypothetical protein
VKSALTALRLDDFRWYWLESESTRVGSAAMVLGTFLLLAFNRLGWPDFAFRATTRFLLIGLYGWLGLSLATFVVVRLVFRRSGPLPTLIKLVGHAHLPLLFAAIVMQVVSVSLDITGVARWPAVFAAVFWMPAMLAAGTRAWTGLSRAQAVASAAAPYLAWAATVGRFIWDQLDHLL